MAFFFGSEADAPAGRLTSTLRPYQRRALAWMLQRERGCRATNPAYRLFPSNAAGLVLTAAEAACDVGYHLVTGNIAVSSRELSSQPGAFSALVGASSDKSSSASSIKRSESEHLDSLMMPCVRGGILAEAPGLGKTVEILALIVSNPRPAAECGTLATAANDVFIAREIQHLAQNVEVPDLLRSGATLIVAPAAIVLQVQTLRES